MTLKFTEIGRDVELVCIKELEFATNSGGTYITVIGDVMISEWTESNHDGTKANVYLKFKERRLNRFSRWLDWEVVSEHFDLEIRKTNPSAEWS